MDPWLVTSTFGTRSGTPPIQPSATLPRGSADSLADRGIQAVAKFQRYLRSPEAKRNAARRYRRKWTPKTENAPKEKNASSGPNDQNGSNDQNETNDSNDSNGPND